MITIVSSLSTRWAMSCTNQCFASKTLWNGLVYRPYAYILQRATQGRAQSWPYRRYGMKCTEKKYVYAVTGKKDNRHKSVCDNVSLKNYATNPSRCMRQRSGGSRQTILVYEHTRKTQKNTACEQRQPINASGGSVKRSAVSAIPRQHVE